ncbi:hypothetical protein BH10PLA1_BH10PLA1_21080 [soil metagenome]
MLMDVRFINPFIRSCHHLFDRHLGMSVTVEKPFVKGTRPSEPSELAVSIAIDLSGAVRGWVIVHFNESVATALAHSFTGDTHQHIDTSTKDALRELTNIMVGSAKREFPGDLTQISPPRILPSSIDSTKQERGVLVIPLKCVAGRFEIEVKIQSISEAQMILERSFAAPIFVEPDVNEIEVQEMVQRLLSAQSAVGAAAVTSERR